jgi:hypothetical protein
MLLTFFSLLAPAIAQVQIDDLHISRDGEVVNIRVSLRNPGPQSQSGPLRVELLARPLGASDWQPIWVWSDLKGLPVGYRLSRDFFSEDGDTVSNLAQGEFEVRAILSGPRELQQTMDKVAEHDPDHAH